MISVLVVNRHRLIREVWVDFLSAREDIHVVGETGQIEDACQLAIARTPRIILAAVDVIHAMTLRGLTKLCFHSRDTRLILVSGFFPIPVRRQLEEMGVHSWLSKESSLQELPAAILATFAGKRYVDKATYAEWEKPLQERPRSAMARLTAREWQVANFLGMGQTSKEIATVLNVSYKTVGVYRHHILKKLNCRNTTQLADKLFGCASE